MTSVTLSWFVVLILLLAVIELHARPVAPYSVHHRAKRQFRLNIGATHEDGYGTDVTLETLASLWESKSGNTKIDGSASYNQHFGGMGGDGHDYRLKLKVVFT